MYASLLPYGEKGMEERTILSFPWETELVQEATVKNKEELLKELEESNLFWEQWDNRKQNKA